MDLVTFGLGTTTGTWVGRPYMHTCTVHIHVHLCMLGQARETSETVGNHGFGNFPTGNHHWDRLGNPYMHTCTVHVHVHLCMLGQAQETMGNHGFGNFRSGNHRWDRLGKQWETMDLVTFGLGITTWTGSGNHGKPWLV